MFKIQKKIFIIGFNKSGTKTLHHFFCNNGFNSIHNDFGKLTTRMVENCINRKKIFSGYDQKYQVFSDMLFLNEKIHIEGNQFFKVIDRDYPNSLFIYNYRSQDNWINSRLNHGIDSKNTSFIDRSLEVYAEDTQLVTMRWKQTRLEFEKEILAYFSGSEKLLTLDIEDVNLNHSEIISKFIGYQMDAKHWVWKGKKGEQSIRKNNFLAIKKLFSILKN